MTFEEALALSRRILADINKRGAGFRDYFGLSLMIHSPTLVLAEKNWELYLEGDFRWPGSNYLTSYTAWSQLRNRLTETYSVYGEES